MLYAAAKMPHIQAKNKIKEKLYVALFCHGADQHTWEILDQYISQYVSIIINKTQGNIFWMNGVCPSNTHNHKIRKVACGGPTPS